KVVQALKDVKYDFGIIAGDNVYEKKSKKDGIKIKIYDKDILDNGINCIEQLNVPLFACLGNHDVRTCNILEDEIKRTYIYMKDAELFVNTDNSKWILPHNYYDLIFENKSKRFHFIFIDTNLCYN